MTLADALACVAISAGFCSVVVLRRHPATAVVLLSLLYFFPTYAGVYALLRVIRVVRASMASDLLVVSITLLLIYHHWYRSSFGGGPIHSYPLAALSTTSLFGALLLFELYVFLILRRRLIR